MKLWLDDDRDPRDKFIQYQFGAEGDEIWVKTAIAAISYLKQGDVAYISLDHDLGPVSAGTGLDVAKWIEEQAFLGLLPRLTWSVHSMNPVGEKAIYKAMMQAEKFWNKPKCTTDPLANYDTTDKGENLL
jgi:hypothetical protein